MEKIRLGFIGTGEAARTIHLPVVQAQPELFEIVNACSRNEEKCRQFAAMAGAARWCTDYRDLLADSNVDAVVITAPFELNYPFMREALAAGKHVFVEKPLADSLERAREMVKWSEETRLVSLFAENYRYRDGVRILKDEYIDKGVIGKPTIMVYSNYAHIDRNSPWLVNGPWRLSCVGGIVTERFVHYVAAVREIMGDARCAVGYGGKMRENIGPYDYGTLSIVFENGGTGIVHDVASLTGYKRQEMLVVGTEGSITAENYFQTIHVANTRGLDIKFQLDDRIKSYQSEFADFYECIHTGKKPRSTIYEGYKDLQLALLAIGGEEGWRGLTLPK